MVEVSSVGKIFRSAFSRVEALKEVSFQLEEQDVLGIIGPNGAGKTTLMKLLLGFLRPSRGSVQLFGVNPRSIESKRYLGYLPEQSTLYRYLTGWEFLELCGELYGMETRAARLRAEELLEKLQLTDAASRAVGSYSKGMQQRLALAASVLHGPRLLLLDEPMSGLDPLGRMKVTQVLMEERIKGTAMILNSHILSDMERLCSRVLVLHQGCMLGERTLDKKIKAGDLESYFLETIAHYDA